MHMRLFDARTFASRPSAGTAHLHWLSETRMVDLWSLRRNFWILLTGSFLAAVLSSTAAVWIISRPFVEETKATAVQALARAVADQISDRLLPARNLIGFLASDAELVDLVMGDSFNADPVAARMQAVAPPEGLIAVEVFDFLGDAMFLHPWDASELNDASRLAMREAASRILAEEPGESAVLVEHEGTAGRVVAVATTIGKEGLVEGAVVALVQVDVAGPNASEGQAMSTELVLFHGNEISGADPQDFPEDTRLAPVGASGLRVAAIPDADFSERSVRVFVARNLLAVSLSLCLPFLLFAYFGQRAIVDPSRQLALSREALREKSRELAELAAVAQMSEEAIVLTDSRSRVTWVNEAFVRITGFDLNDVRGKVPGQVLQGPKTDEAAVRRIREALSAKEPISQELINYSKSGLPYWIRLSISPLYDADGRHYGFMAISSDISERKRDEEKLAEASRAIEMQAMHDELTGLPNRRHFNLELDRRAQHNDGRALTIVRVDLDHFKYVNDTAGHEAGDHVLVKVAEILQSGCRSGDLAVRIGGDEFVMLMAPGAGAKETAAACSRLQARIRTPMPFEGKQLSVGASFGVASDEGGLVSSGEVLQAADAALYRAKAEGRNKIVLYAPEIHSTVVEHRALADQIRDAVLQKAFVPFFQPQVDAVTGALAGAEVLGRWRAEDGEIKAPAQFMDVADQMGLLTEIDRILMDKALQDAARIRSAGITLEKLSFNMTAARLTDPELVTVLKEAKDESFCIALEILETVFLDGGRTNYEFAIDGLRDSGFLIEIDDFGSGHASMISLMRVRPDALKIDKRLVIEAPMSPAHEEMVRAIVGIAKALDIRVIAEGVETEEHVALMQKTRCDVLQGFHFARPMPADDFITQCYQRGWGRVVDGDTARRA